MGGGRKERAKKRLNVTSRRQKLECRFFLPRPQLRSNRRIRWIRQRDQTRIIIADVQWYSASSLRFCARILLIWRRLPCDRIRLTRARRKFQVRLVVASSRVQKHINSARGRSNVEESAVVSEQSVFFHRIWLRSPCPFLSF